MKNYARFRDFVARLSTLVDEAGGDEPLLFAGGVPLLSSLVAHDDWLPGGDIGAIRRHRFEPDGREFEFISGYSNTSLPNFWDRSGEAIR